MKKEIIKIKRIMIMAVIFLVLIIICLYWENYLKNSPQTTKKTDLATENVKQQKEEKFSRISLFLTSKKSSIAVPESWEGKYRVKEEGSVARFIYIGNSDIQADIFRIEYFPDGLKNHATNGLLQVKKYENFAYIKPNDNIYAGAQKDEFDNMRNRVDELIKGFDTIN